MFSLVQSHFVDVLQQIQGRSCPPITLVESKDKKKSAKKKCWKTQQTIKLRRAQKNACKQNTISFDSFSGYLNLHYLLREQTFLVLIWEHK